MRNRKHSYFLIAIGLALNFQSISQTLCSESAYMRQFSGATWYSLEKIHVAPAEFNNTLFFFNVFDTLNNFGLPVTGGNMLIKIDRNGDMVWSKKISGKTDIIGLNEMKRLSNGDILFSGRVTKPSMSGGNSFNLLIRTDSSGNFKWKKVFDGDVHQFYVERCFETPKGNLIIPSSISERFQVNRLYPLLCLTQNGDLLWSKTYHIPNISEGYHIDPPLITQCAENELGLFFSCYTLSNNLGNLSPSYLYALKADAFTGTLIQSRSITFQGKSLVGVSDVVFREGKFDIWGSGVSNSKMFIYNMMISQDLKILKYSKYLGPEGSKNLLPDLSVSDEGQATGSYVLRTDSTKTGFFFAISKDLQYIFSKKISLKPSLNNFQLLNKGKEKYLLLFDYLGGRSDAHFIVSEFSADMDPDRICAGDDVKPGFVLEGTNSLVDEGFQITEFENPIKIEDIREEVSLKNYYVRNDVLCEHLSICDSINIKGNTIICNVEDTQYFKIEKRNDCLKRVQWDIDKEAGEIFTLNDSTLKVQFNSNWKGGFLKASIPSCGLIDSIQVVVIPKIADVQLGNDTTLCNNTLTLRSGNIYASYRWQDGSTADTLNVSTSGKYWVTVADSCGRISSDTVEIHSVDLNFSVGIDREICLYDSVYLDATKGFYDYRWTSSDNSLISTSKNSAVGIPESTTRYLVSAEKFPGCRVKDSVVIHVKDCPRTIFFPNAFSPNGDGLNDLFKPIVSGKMSQYYFRIYNRYGQLIFETNELQKGWDGRFRTENVPVGIYTWTCSYAFRRQPAKNIKGKVVLLR